MAMGPLRCRGRTLAFVIAGWLINLATGIYASAESRESGWLQSRFGPVVRREIPSDGNSFFRAILFSLKMTEEQVKEQVTPGEVFPVTPQELRDVVSGYYRGLLQRLGESREPTPREKEDVNAYADHIRFDGNEPEQGGMREAKVLSKHLDVQICIIDIHSEQGARCVPEHPTGWKRIFLLQDGDHFDCVVKPAISDGLFQVSDTESMKRAVALAAELQAVKREEMRERE